MDDGGISEEVDLTPEEAEIIKRMKTTPKLYKKLVDSIAPTVFGNTINLQCSILINDITHRSQRGKEGNIVNAIWWSTQSDYGGNQFKRRHQCVYSG